MTRIEKQNYLRMTECQTVEWLTQCAKNPTPWMRPMCVKLIWIAIRRRTA